MRVGLDIGSTTIKCVVLNDAEQIVYSTYERHYSHILEKGKELLHRAAAADETSAGDEGDTDEELAQE